MMTEKQILAQLKRKYDAEMVSALVGAGFTKNVYNKAFDWTGLLNGLVEKAYASELERMYSDYTHMRFGVDVKPYEDCKQEFMPGGQFCVTGSASPVSSGDIIKTSARFTTN